MDNEANTRISRLERARRFTDGQRNSRVFGDTVRPFWAADGSLFSYCRRTPEGNVYLLVEPATGKVEPLFDQDALAAEITRAKIAPGLAASEIQDVRLSADGNGVDFRLGDRFWRAERNTLALTEQGIAGLPGENIAPDGSAHIVIADHNLWLVESSGIRIPLTDDGEAGNGYGDFLSFDAALAQSRFPARFPAAAIWSQDSRRIATMRTDLRRAPLAHLIEAVPEHGSRPKLHSFPYPIPGDQHGAKLELWFVDRTGQRVRAELGGLESFAFNPLFSHPAWWSDDGCFFHFIESARDGNRIDLWQVAATTGSAERLIIDEYPGVGRPRFGPASRPRMLRDGRILWASEADGWSHLYLVDAGDPLSRRRITSGAWNVVSILHVNEDDEIILFAAAGREAKLDPYYLHVYSIRFDGSELCRLTHESLNHDPTIPPGMLAQMRAGNRRPPSGVSPDGRFFVASHEAVDQPPVSVLYDRQGKVITTLERADASEAWPADMPLPEPFHVLALDGATDLWGVLYKPPGFDPGLAYPVIDVIYGGPQMAMTPKSFSQTPYGAYAEMLAAAGFITLVMDGPGTPGRSRDFWFRSYGQMESCGGLDDHVAAIKHLADERPWMRVAGGVGLTGFSGGGYATVRGMATYPDFFTVGVAICGNHDIATYIAQWAELFEGMDPASYLDLANANVADRIRGDLLLIQGEMDDNVHPAQMLRLVDALVKADVDFDMLVVPSADHGVVNHPYARRRTIDFFLRHLRII